MNFYEFASQYFWLLFILAFFIGAAWDGWLKYQRQRASLDVLRAYAQSGKEPPEEVLKALKKTSIMDDLGVDGSETQKSQRSPATSAFLVVLLGGLAAIFAYAGYTGMLGLGEEGYFVAAILGVIAFAFLISAFFKGGSGY